MWRWLVAAAVGCGCAATAPAVVETEDLVVPVRTAREETRREDRHRLMAGVLSQKAALARCAEAYARSMRGAKVWLVWDVEADGSVTNLGVATAEFARTKMARCLADAVQGVNFGPAAEPVRAIVFPFTF